MKNLVKNLFRVNTLNKVLAFTLINHVTYTNAAAIIESGVNSTLVENSTNSAITEKKVLNKQESIEYLKSNPSELEVLLSHLLLRQDAESLKELLPLYAKYPQRDESVIEWGNAIIAMKAGNTERAINLYRKVNAVLPDVKTLRFQLAFALYQDKQYKAAKNELEKLRSGLTNPAEIQQVNAYIKAIDGQDRWTFDFNLNFLNNNNITNAPEIGTQINDGAIVYTQPHEEGQGLGYSLGATKKWAFDDRFFATTRFNSYGKNYWNNQKFNEVAANVGLGVGYQNAKTEVELYPSFTQSWYAGGTSRTENKEELQKYSQTKAVNLTYSQWINPKLLYQNFSQYGMTRYVPAYAVNDLDTKLTANTLVYLPTQTRSFSGGLDYIVADNMQGHDGDSYNRRGIRLGWGEAWGKGISTRMSLGYAQKDYDAPQDFINIQRANKEYDLGLSIWKRDFTVFKLTPRLTWNYHTVKSNSALEEYSKNSMDLEFTQTF